MPKIKHHLHHNKAMLRPMDLKILFYFVLLAILVVALFFIGKAGGRETVLGADSKKYEIEFSQDKVDVYAKELASPLPSFLDLKIKKDGRFIDRVKLQFMELNAEGLPHFSGHFDPQNQSHLGLQFEIALGK